MVKKLMNDYFLSSVRDAGKSLDLSKANAETLRLYRMGMIYEYEVFEACPDCLA